jgi:hypothetical protein
VLVIVPRNLPWKGCLVEGQAAENVAVDEQYGARQKKKEAKQPALE